MAMLGAREEGAILTAPGWEVQGQEGVVVTIEDRKSQSGGLLEGGCVCSAGLDSITTATQGDSCVDVLIYCRS